MRLKKGLRRLAALGLTVFAAQAALADPLIISEFRVRGPSGANDEFVEIYNATTADHTVAGGGTGYAVAASDGVARFVIPNGTVIPAHGHYLGTNSQAYSLSGNAAGDATYTTDIPDNAGIALFNTSVAVDFILANRMDAVGSTSEANTLYKEGTGYLALTPFSIDYSFYRDQCGKAGIITTMGACPDGATVKDSDNNAVDFVFVDTNGTSAGAGQRLGAPGPQNLASPINRPGLDVADLLDACLDKYAAPNAVRDFTSVPASNSTFGTEDLRFTYTNNSGADLTRLRFRIVDITTFPAPSGFSDMRPITSTDVVVSVDRPPCGSGTSNVTVHGTTLEQPPSQPNGSGFNGSLSVGAVSVGTPLANNASIDVRVLNGLQQTGNFKLGLVPEGLTRSGVNVGGGVIYFECTTDAGCAPPSVVSIVRAGPNPTGASSVDFTVTFSTNVTGVDASDFNFTTTGGIDGVGVINVSGSGAVYNVAVGIDVGQGTVRLNVVDNDSIVAGTTPLGGIGAGNGNFNAGEAYDVDRDAPTVTAEQAAGQTDSTPTSPIDFTVTFSEAVTGFDSADVAISGTAGATTAVITGGPTVFNVAVSGMTGPGTVIIDVPANAATDALGNESDASTSADNSVTFAPDAPSVTAEQAAGQADPATTAPISFTVTFSEAVTGFDSGDVLIGGSAGATTAVVSGGPTIYAVSVSGMTGAGTVTISVPAGAALSALNVPSTASTSVDNSVTYAPSAPSVTANQAAGQADPTTTGPIAFTVTFSEAVTGFDASDVTIGGTAGATTAVVSGGPAIYTVAVSGMTASGTVTISIPSGAAANALNVPSTASTSTDSSVTYNARAVTPFTPTAVPTLSPQGLLVLALGMLGLGWSVRRRASR